MTASLQRSGIAVTVLACALLPVLAASPNDGAVKLFEGRVVPVGELLPKSGTRLDEDAAPFSLALKADDGKVYTLVKDDGSRMFFKDAVLLRRPMRLTGALLPGSQILQVVQVHSYLDKKLHEVYYWCDICTIKRYEKKLCECCNAPMELRETPVEP